MRLLRSEAFCMQSCVVGGCFENVVPTYQCRANLDMLDPKGSRILPELLLTSARPSRQANFNAHLDILSAASFSNIILLSTANRLLQLDAEVWSLLSKKHGYHIVINHHVDYALRESSSSNGGREQQWSAGSRNGAQRTRSICSCASATITHASVPTPRIEQPPTKC